MLVGSFFSGWMFIFISILAILCHKRFNKKLRLQALVIFQAFKNRMWRANVVLS